jgi:hypothetical protein
MARYRPERMNSARRARTEKEMLNVPDSSFGCLCKLSLENMQFSIDHEILMLRALVAEYVRPQALRVGCQTKTLASLSEGPVHRQEPYRRRGRGDRAICD